MDNSLITTKAVIAKRMPLVAALIFTHALVAALRYWHPVPHDDGPVQRWLRVVPLA